MTPEAQALVDLAERCEAATGADRHLDADIGMAIDKAWCLGTVHGYDSRGSWSFLGLTLVEACTAYPDRKTTAAIFYHVPTYTASLDAAMTLLDDYRQFNPDQCGFAPSVLRLHDGSGAADVHVSPHGDLVFGKAANPALALCAASLRALSLIEATHGEGGMG